MFYLEQFVDDRNELRAKVWGNKGINIVDAYCNPYCFVRGSDGNGFVDAIEHKSVKKYEVNLPAEINKLKDRLVTFESDILMERVWMKDFNLQISQDLNIAYVDIEADDSNGLPLPDRNRVLSIGVVLNDGKEYWLSNDDELVMFEQFFNLMSNVAIIWTYYGGEDGLDDRGFDLPYLAKRYSCLSGSDLTDFNKGLRHIVFYDMYRVYKYELGRVEDKSKLLKMGSGLSLDEVAERELGEHKVSRSSKVSELSKSDLREYNLQDCRLLKMLDEKFMFSKLKIGLARLTNCRLTSFNWRQGRKKDELTPLTMTDMLVLKEARKLGLVLPDMESRSGDDRIQGAYVKMPLSGLHSGVAVFDVRQMYPNIIINERISPDKDGVILPNVVKMLMKERARYKELYKKTRSVRDYIYQYSYKVLSNIIYGAVGNRYFRLYRPELASAITAKGRELITNVIGLCERLGLTVCYGDTDSVFVKVDRDKVDDVLAVINSYIVPYEMEFKEYYESVLFFGDSKRAVKKRYIGRVGDDVSAVGVELVKRDYCLLAKEVQYNVARMILFGSGREEIDRYLLEVKKRLYSGKEDTKLTLTKSVRNLNEYKYKEGHRGSPHVRAYKKLIERGLGNVVDIMYVHTKEDVEPVVDGQLPTNINYTYYWDRQIMPVVMRLLDSVAVSQRLDAYV